MRQKPGTAKPTAESMVKDIRRRTRKHHSAEEKIRIVLEGLRDAGQHRHIPTTDRYARGRNESIAKVVRLRTTHGTVRHTSVTPDAP